MRNSRYVRSAVAISLSLAAGTAWAQAQNYPTGLVKIVSSAQPGSMPDVMARIMADKLAANFGKPVIVEPHPGAAGLTGAQFVSKANPDGHTLEIYTASDLLAPLVNPGTVDPKDLAVVGTVATLPTVLVVSTASRFKTLEDLVAAAKANPGQVVVTSAGFLTATHLTFERFRASSRLNFLHVPSKGGPGAINELLAGRADVYFAPIPAALPLIKGNKVRPLAMGSPTRTPLLPGVATTLEMGYPNSDYNFWVGVAAPAKTPRPIVLRINKEIAAAVAAPDMVERFRGIGVDPWTIPLPEFDAMVKDELELNARLI